MADTYHLESIQKAPSLQRESFPDRSWKIPLLLACASCRHSPKPVRCCLRSQYVATASRANSFGDLCRRCMFIGPEAACMASSLHQKLVRKFFVPKLLPGNSRPPKRCLLSEAPGQNGATFRVSHEIVIRWSWFCDLQSMEVPSAEAMGILRERVFGLGCGDQMSSDQ